MGAENNLIRDFERENNTLLDVKNREKQRKRDKNGNITRKFNINC